jgi:hypothetical protein
LSWKTEIEELAEAKGPLTIFMSPQLYNKFSSLPGMFKLNSNKNITINFTDRRKENEIETKSPELTLLPDETLLCQKYKNMLKVIDTLYLPPNNDMNIKNLERTLNSASNTINLSESGILAYQSYKSTGSLNFLKGYTKGREIVQTAHKSFPVNNNVEVDKPSFINRTS